MTQPLHIPMNKRTAEALAVITEKTGLGKNAAVRFAVQQFAESIANKQAVHEIYRQPEKPAERVTA